jgi:DNA-binding transcriptional LysR family regulator
MRSKEPVIVFGSPRVDIQKMRHLLAVREHGSFAKAAQALQISQPSLSASISRLEDRLKVKLFDRSAAGSIVTPVGEFVADRASRVIAEVERITRATALVSGGDTGTVRIGFGSTTKQIFMSRLVTEIATAKPELRLSLHVDAPINLLSRLRAQEIDIAICAAPPDLVKDLTVSEIATVTVIAVASPSHALAHERPLSVKRFLEFPIAGPRLKGVPRIVFRMADENDAITQYDANDFEALIPLALSGLATLIAPNYVVQPHVESGALVELDLEFFPVPLAVLTNEANSSAPIVKEIIRRTRELADRL